MGTKEPIALPKSPQQWLENERHASKALAESFILQNQNLMLLVTLFLKLEIWKNHTHQLIFMLDSSRTVSTKTVFLTLFFKDVPNLPLVSFALHDLRILNVLGTCGYIIILYVFTQNKTIIINTSVHTFIRTFVCHPHFKSENDELLHTKQEEGNCILETLKKNNPITFLPFKTKVFVHLMRFCMLQVHSFTVIIFSFRNGLRLIN